MSTQEKLADDVKGLEFVFATYSRSDRSNDDMLTVKENIHYKDGRIEPNVRRFKNFKRNFWITREGYRNHKDKKEWEEEHKLMKFTCTQAEMPLAVARALGRPLAEGGLRQLARSPYLYGTDIPTTSLLKHNYQKRWPDCISPKASVAVLDIETDVVWGTEEILTIALTFKNRVVLAVNKKFVKGIYDAEQKTQAAFEKYLGEVKKARNITLDIVMCDTPTECVSAVFKKAHEWKPDFIAIWNMNFDLPKMEKTVTEAGGQMKDIVSDPSVPHEFRYYNFKEGPNQKVAASGRVMLLSPAERWHIVTSTSSFYFIDAMCLYKRIRIQKGNEVSYALDYILNKELGMRKLKFEEVKSEGLRWHQEMQSNYQIEYLIYNIWDCISIEVLDEKNKDIAQAFSAQCGISDFSRFKSNPTRIVDDLHFFAREAGLVCASMADTVATELDAHVIGIEGWITTLPSHLLDDNGLNLIKELPDVRSNMRGHVADLDITSTYPSNQTIANISKETTYREMGAIEGISELDRRMVGINLSGGTTNAIEICMTMLKAPSPMELLEAFEQENPVIEGEFRANAI